MLRTLLSLALCLLTAPLRAGLEVVPSEGAPPPPTSESEWSEHDGVLPTDTDWLEKFRSRTLGLEGMLFAVPELPPPDCRIGQDQVTRGLLIAPDNPFLETGPRFDGSLNDAELLRNVLAGRGADPANIRILAGQNATLESIAPAALALLKEVN